MAIVGGAGKSKMLPSASRACGRRKTKGSIISILQIYPRRLDLPHSGRACFPTLWPRSGDSGRSVAWKGASGQPVGLSRHGIQPSHEPGMRPAVPVSVRQAAFQSMQMQIAWLGVPQSLPYSQDGPLIDLGMNEPEQPRPGNQRHW
jgi:hypothetical protein